jgi:hypothetical protein
MEKLSKYFWSNSFASDCCATVLATKMCANYDEHSVYNRLISECPKKKLL